MKKTKRFAGGGGSSRSSYQGNDNSYTQDSDLDASESVDKGALSRRLAAANAEKPAIGPVKEYPKGRDFDAVEEEKSTAVARPAYSVGPKETSSYGSENRRTAQDTSRKTPVVTKEELEKSGMSLRDYLNKQQGLTRRGGSSDSYRMEGANKAAPEENYRTEGARKKPMGNLGGGKYGSEAGVYTDLRNPANARDIYNAPDRFSAANIRSALGMKKGGAVKMASGGSISSASRRADGIAQKGKTRGKMC